MKSMTKNMGKCLNKYLFHWMQKMNLRKEECKLQRLKTLRMSLIDMREGKHSFLWNCSLL